jgi:hypothetical protein
MCKGQWWDLVVAVAVPLVSPVLPAKGNEVRGVKGRESWSARA